jgi:hypothetical protein
MLIALVLSHMIDIGSSYSTLISFSVYFIQRTCVQHAIDASYSTSVMDREIEVFFFLNHDMR